MSGDKRGDRTQEVVGSIPISSTNPISLDAGGNAGVLFARTLAARYHELTSSMTS